MSAKTKQYILQLDIEKDARVLKERLNICTEAVDYFCASSSILKAGVKAGLSLYDIAIMCCRNDNLGEVPSKLEMLFDMAAGLARSAIENGRWHHAAASQALEEQLSPKSGSLFNYAAPVSSNHMQKAQSAVDLAHYTQDLKDMYSKKDSIPDRVMSSASDSSSDNADGGDTERDECQEWATNLIADISLDKSMAALTKKGRSHSIESESSTESDGEGFWYTNPNTSPALSTDSDDESISWTPKNSPPIVSFMELSASSLRNSFNPISGLSRRASIVLNEDDVSNAFAQFRSPSKVVSKVTFPDEPVLEDSPEKRDLEPQFKHSNSDVGHLHAPPLPPKESTMRRSQSYSALTSTMVKEQDVENTEALRSVDPKKHREYFLKFIDLVIVCETTAASQAKQVAGVVS